MPSHLAELAAVQQEIRQFHRFHNNYLLAAVIEGNRWLPTIVVATVIHVRTIPLTTVVQVPPVGPCR